MLVVLLGFENVLAKGSLLFVGIFYGTSNICEGVIHI